MSHQERTEQAAQSVDPRNTSSQSLALWHIAHSLAAIADALTFRQRYVFDPSLDDEIPDEVVANLKKFGESL